MTSDHRTTPQHHPWRPKDRPQQGSVAHRAGGGRTHGVGCDARRDGTAAERMPVAAPEPHRRRQHLNLLDIAPSGYVVGQGATPPWNPRTVPQNRPRQHRWTHESGPDTAPDGRDAPRQLDTWHPGHIEHLGKHVAQLEDRHWATSGRFLGFPKGSLTPWPTDIAPAMSSRLSRALHFFAIDLYTTVGTYQGGRPWQI